MRRPSHCITLRPARTTQLWRYLRRLLLKKAPWPQGAWPLDETHRVQRPRSMKRAAKRSLALKKSLACSQRQHAMTALLF